MDSVESNKWQSFARDYELMDTDGMIGSEYIGSFYKTVQSRSEAARDYVQQITI